MDYNNRINTTFKSWIPQSGEEWDNGPCGKCHPQGCLDEYNGYTVWQCRHGSWFVDEEPSQEPLSVGHCHTVCRGNCPEHPLMDEDTLKISRRIRAAGPSRTTWGDIMWEEEQAYLAAETDAQRNSRLEAEAAHERKGKQEIVKYLVHRKEEKWTKGGEMKFRVPRPCKYATLFAQRTCANCSAHVPVGQTHCKAMKGHLVCDQELAGCWNHEQTHTCIYVHPDEPQWADACSGVLCYDRQAACFHLRGAQPPQPAQVNRFVAAARQEQRGAPQRQDERVQQRGQPSGGYRSAAGGGYQSHGKGARQDDGWEQAGGGRRR